MKLSYIIICLIVSPIFFTTALAQNHFGFGGGINFANVQKTGDSGFITKDRRAGPTVRGFVEFGINKKLALQPEFNYIRKGLRRYFPNPADINFPPIIDAWIRLDYLSFNFLAKYYFAENSMKRQRLIANKFGLNGYLLGGLYLGIEGDKKVVNSAGMVLNSSGGINLLTGDLGAITGLGAIITRKRFSVFLEARYAHGIIRLNERIIADGAIRNSSIGIEAGLQFRI